MMQLMSHDATDVTYYDHSILTIDQMEQDMALIPCRWTWAHNALRAPEKETVNLEAQHNPFQIHHGFYPCLHTSLVESG